MDYEDFEIRIEPDGHGGLRVRAESPAGQGAGPFAAPFDLDRAFEEGVDLNEEKPRFVLPSEDDARLDPGKLASGLFQALFPHEVRSLYERSLERVKPKGLRLRLRIDPRFPQRGTGKGLTNISRLPWELLHDAENDRFPSLERDRPLVRSLDVPEATPTAGTSALLRLLVVVSHPNGLAPLGVGEERRRLEEIAEESESLQLSFLERPDLDKVRRALVEGAYDVLHFMGHGRFDPATRRGQLAFETPERQPDFVDGSDVAIKLRDVGSLRLVVVGACESAVSGGAGRWAFAGVAEALVRGGIPAVVAMQAPVSDRAAIDFTEAFYRRLAAGEPIEAALAEGRQAIHSRRPASWEWAIPVLFSRLPHGRIVEAPDVPREELLERYLGWLAEQTEHVELPGLPRVDHRRSIDLEDVFVPLGVEFANPYERARSREVLEDEARRLENLLAVEELTPRERYRWIWGQVSRLARDPGTGTLGEHPRNHEETDSPELDELLRRHSRLVILGDPGSGKSTLVRRLALERTRASRPEGAVPILVRIAAFAADREARPGRRLVEFLGRHVAPPGGGPAVLDSGEELDPEALHRMLRRTLEQGRAFVLLDGLDEIADAAERHEVAREIEAFLDAWVPEDRDPSGAAEEPRPGNRVILTSRSVGYASAGLDAGAVHLSLAPLSADAVDRFCEAWTEAMNRATVRPWDEAARRASRREAEALRQAIGELRRRGAGELAGNPLLVTVLALVFRHSRRSLPRRRIRLYEAAVDVLIERWRRRSASPFDVRTVLGVLLPLAAEIHDGSALGLIDEAGLRKVLARHLGDEEADAFRAVIREEVGLLTARAEGVYGFLHLAFQEYLAAHWLVAEKEETVARLVAKVDDPRWHEPVLMALGLLSVRCKAEELGEVLSALLDAPDLLDPLLPRSALLLAAALPEMEQVPPGIVSTALRRLLDACSRGPGDLAPPVPIGAAAAELRAADPGGEVERVLTEALAAPDDGRARAAARLALAAGCASSGLAEALVRAWDRDARPWPIERALAEIAAREPRYLPDPRGSLRRTLLSRPELAERFLADPAWRRLGLVVYAGLDPESFPRDVAWLTRLVLDALGSGRPPDALVPELGRYAEPAETRLDALLALVALPAPLPELEPEDDERLEAALRRVAARVRMPEGADKPELLRLALAVPPELRPVLLAELWQLLPAGSHHDPVYNAAVFLDTHGAFLAEEPRLLAETLAVAARAPEDLPRDLRGLLALALDALAAVPEPFDFVRGWALVCLKPLLVETGLLDEALELAHDLSERFDARAHTLKQLSDGRSVAPRAKAGTRTCSSRERTAGRACLLLRHSGDLGPSGAAVRLTTTALVEERLGRHGAGPPSAGPPGPEVPGELLDAEARGLSERTLPAVLRLLEAPDDRIRYRAALALHGDASSTRRRPTVRRLGRAALERLAREWSDRYESEPRTALVLRWAFETIEHDDPEAVAAWAESLDRGDREAEAAETILGEIHAVDSGTWPAVSEAFTNGSARTKKALVRSFSTLLARRRLPRRGRSEQRPEEPWKRIADVLDSIDVSAWEGETFVLDGPAAVVDAAESALGLSPREAADLAERRYREARRRWCAELGRGSGEIRETLTAVGAGRLVTRESEAACEAAGERVAAAPPVLEVILDWASRRLEVDVRDASLDERLTSDLLEVSAAAAARLPDTYLAKVRPPRGGSGGEARALPAWERRLREVVEYGNWFPARRAALVLLSLGRRVTGDVVAAWRAALRDVIAVRRTALATAGRYREVEPGAVALLARDLAHPSASLALAAARMLAAVARNAHFSPAVRGEAAAALAAAARDPRSRRGVYLLAEESRGPHDRHWYVDPVGRLDELIVRLLAESHGLADLFERHSATAGAPS